MVAKSIMNGAIAVTLSVAPAFADADPVAVANSVRLRGCSDMPPVTGPLRPEARLHEAARRIAAGDKLQTATSASEYRAKKSASIRIKTTKGDDGIAAILERRFCDLVADPDLREIGVFQRGDATWMVLARPFTALSPADAAAMRQRVFELINEARRQARHCGRREFPATTPLRPAAALEKAASDHARDMAARSYLGHRGSDGSKAADRATRAGYQWVAVAENVAAGQATAEEVVNTWLASPGHCANLMSAGYSETGVAYATNPAADKVTFWVQVFAAPE